MTRTQSARRQFKFERLEERIAPTCVVWGSAYDAPAASSDLPRLASPAPVNHFLDPIALLNGFVHGLKERIRPVIAGTATVTAHHSPVVALRTATPVDDLLREIHERFNPATASAAQVVANSFGTANPSIAGASGAGQSQNSPAKDQTSQPAPAVRKPDWADAFLHELDLRFNTAQSAEAPRSEQQISKAQTLLLETIDREFNRDNSFSSDGARSSGDQMPPWAEDLLHDIQKQLETDVNCLPAGERTRRQQRRELSAATYAG